MPYPLHGPKLQICGSASRVQKGTRQPIAHPPAFNTPTINTQQHKPPQMRVGAATAALLLLSGLACSSSLPIKGSSSDLYIILIDAGSSGSRVHVHQYHDGDIPVVQPSDSIKIKPGLSSYATSPTTAGESLVPTPLAC